MKILAAFWRMFWAFAFYPLTFALLIWFWTKDAHWLWGLAVMAAVFILDPIWGLIARRIISWRPHKDEE
jgi:hypothetical protein